MSLKRIFLLFSGVALFAGCATDPTYKAEEPVDYKDQNRYGFGSLIRDKNGALKYFGSSSKCNTSEEKKISIERVDNDSAKQTVLWDKVLDSLKDFPIEFMDKKTGIIETENVKISQFDNTGACSYKVVVKILDSKNIDVKITSNEDSVARLRKHEDILKAQILNK